MPPHLLEAARGMGMTAGQAFRRVEFPNALSAIFAGIRTALAICVGKIEGLQCSRKNNVSLSLPRAFGSFTSLEIPHSFCYVLSHLLSPSFLPST